MDIKFESQEKVVAILNRQDSEFFSVVFFRRTDRRDRSQEAGDLRLFRSCRRRVKKHLRGGPTAYNFRSKRLLSLYLMPSAEDRHSGGYRSVPWEGIFAVKSGGTVYVTMEGLARICDRQTSPSDEEWFRRSMEGFRHVQRLLADAGSPLRLSEGDTPTTRIDLSVPEGT